MHHQATTKKEKEMILTKYPTTKNGWKEEWQMHVLREARSEYFWRDSI